MFLLLKAFCIGLALAASSPTPTEAELQEPVLSATGKKRLEQNVETLANNLKELKENITLSDKNLETIREELRDLGGLEKEHQELKKKYQGYLTHADEEIQKNDRAKRDLAKWEQRHALAPKDAAEGALKDKMEAARLEQGERDRWKTDAQAKIGRVKDLIIGIDRNLAALQSMKKPLEVQLNQWTTRRAGYEKLVSETEAKKAQWEKVMVR